MKEMGVLATNKKVYFDYEILEKFEAGIVLLGQEVKTLKTQGVNLAGTYILIKGEEAFWIGAEIPPYQPSNIGAYYNPQRDRKILLKKEEIKYLLGKTKQKGLTLVPIKLYTKKGIIKMELGLGKKKKKVSKKEEIKKREIKREIEREIKMYR